MPLTPDQKLDLIASTAALYRPEQLHGKAELLLNALLFQHECVLNDLLVGPRESEQMAQFHSFSQDSRAIELILSILSSVEPNFERASKASAQEILDMSRKQLNTDLLDDQKQHLENLLNDN